MQSEGGREAAAILSSHIEMIHDPVMTTQVEQAIRSKGKNTEYIFKSVIGEYEKKFHKISNHFFRERVKDFQDISRRIISHLRKNEKNTLASISYQAIVFAHELSPSDTAEANAQFIEAFVTRSGAETSHVAIMARAKGIPLVSSVDFPDPSKINLHQVIVDGYSGKVILNPAKSTINFYKAEQKKIQIHAKGLKKNQDLDTETFDGFKARLSANIEVFNEVESLPDHGGEGVGLFRSEYLFLAKDTFPSEEDQFLIYRNLVEKVEGYPSVVRTFDIGGDKFGQFHPTRYERNPFLGCRGIRLMLKERAIFKSQIRAIVRASAFGQIHMLFPMISGLSELHEAKELVEEVKQELHAAGIPFSTNIPIGCMIEVPSAALTCDELAQECDFLSIGTNDLVQYSLAVDRNNPSMSYLYSPAHPSILRMIKMVVSEASRTNISVSVCGEIAADPRFTALLLGLGVNELSVSSYSLPIIKNVIRHLSIVEATHLADQALGLSTADEVVKLLIEFYQSLGVKEVQFA